MEKNYVKFPNFSQNAPNFSNSMDRGPIPKKGCESPEINHLYTEKVLMGTLTNSDDPDEMPHYAAFHQGLHCLLRQN